MPWPVIIKENRNTEEMSQYLGKEVYVQVGDSTVKAHLSNYRHVEFFPRPGYTHVIINGEKKISEVPEIDVIE